MKNRRPIHERVSAVVTQLGVDRPTICARTGWNEQRVYRLLAGKTEFSASDIELLSDVIRQPVEALFRGRAA